MEGIELWARREALGMDRDSLATMLGCDAAAGADYETGRQPVPDSADKQLTVLEFTHDQITGILEDRFTPPVLVTYETDEEFWQAWPGMRGIPVCVHRTAVSDALKSLRWAGLAAHVQSPLTPVSQTQD